MTQQEAQRELRALWERADAERQALENDYKAKVSALADRTAAASRALASRGGFSWSGSGVFRQSRESVNWYAYTDRVKSGR